MTFEYTPDNIKKLLIEKPWTTLKKRFDNMPEFVPKVIETIDIDDKEWLEFCVDHYDLGEHVWESPKPHYNEDAKSLVEANLSVGRNKFNSYEINYGKKGNSNQILKSMLGSKNIKKLKLHPDYVLVRLLIKLPGQGVAWHVDAANSFLQLYPDLESDNDFNTQYGPVVRYWFPVTDWEDGHMFQISKTVLWKYAKGQVYHIPFGIGHASGNSGFVPQYSVSLTGVLND